MDDIQLTKNFSLSEFLRSTTAIRLGLDNTPDPAALNNIKTILAPGVQRVRDVLGMAVFVDSGYRSQAVNRAVGGVWNSQHLLGLAADLLCPAFGPPLEIAKFLVQHKDLIVFDQLIQEGDWVHVSFVDRNPRGQILTAHFAGGTAHYTEGLA